MHCLSVGLLKRFWDRSQFYKREWVCRSGLTLDTFHTAQTVLGESWTDSITVSWGFWNARNNYTFGKQLAQPHALASQALELKRELQDAQQLLERVKPNSFFTWNALSVVFVGV